MALAQYPAEPPGGRPAPRVVARLSGPIARSAVDEKAIRATIEELVACGTRHSLSSWEDSRRGIGCGRDRLVARLGGIAKSSGGRLRVVVDRFEATGPRTNDKPVRMGNVLAFSKETIRR